jgi:hypothetical protein
MAKKKKVGQNVHKVTPVTGDGELLAVIDRTASNCHAEFRLLGNPNVAIYMSNYSDPAEVKKIRAAVELIKAELDAFVKTFDNFEPVDIRK